MVKFLRLKTHRGGGGESPHCSLATALKSDVPSCHSVEDYCVVLCAIV